MKRIAIIGHFGGQDRYYDGQTVKTKNLADLLEAQGEFSLYRVDTHMVRTNKLRLMAESISALCTCEAVFLLVADRGMRFYLPFLYYVNRLTRRRIYHYVIGSELLGLVERDPKLVKYLNGLTENWFEYESGTQYLRDKGVRNVSTLPNFKHLTPVPEAAAYADGQHFRFCTFSRVMEEKGITDAITAVRQVNEILGAGTASLDIYGPIEAGYADALKQLLEDNRDHACYKGIVESGSSVEVLKDYYALLFPTRWAGEGVPGTLIDAFAAGIPVIATDWNANGSLVRHGQQGIIYPNPEQTDLVQAVLWAIRNKPEMDRMRFGARAEYEKYTPEAVWRVICHALSQERR